MQPNDPNAQHTHNPYQAPTAMLDESRVDDGELLDEPNRLPASHGISWIMGAWELFMARPSIWLITGLIYFVLIAALGALSALPVLKYLTGILAVYFSVGFAYIAYQLEHDEDVSVGDVFIGFRHNAVNLLLLCILLFVISVIFLVAMAFIVVALFAMVGISVPNAQNLSSLGLMMTIPMMLVAVIILVPIMMIMAYSPLLVFFHDMSVFGAIKFSLSACLRNILPFLLFGVVIIVIFAIAALPFGLGSIVASPLYHAACYISYRQVLTTTE